MTWRLIVHGGAGGAWNMAVDEAIAAAHGAGMVPPTLRLYEWNPPAVSIGYFQDMRREIDTEACAGLGIEWVRRPTGGRAVLHEDEVTYSVAISESMLPGSVLETYLYLGRGLVAALRQLGVPAELVERPPAGARGMSAACFDSPSWYEMTCLGRKVVGSAQTRRNGVILQHGSIPLVMDPGRAVSVLKVPSDDARRRLQNSLGRKAAGLNQVLPRRITRDEVKSAVISGFESALGIEFEPADLTEYEVELASGLERRKYSAPEWNEERRGRGRDV